jgi:hypothetical protein
MLAWFARAGRSELLDTRRVVAGLARRAVDGRKATRRNNIVLHLRHLEVVAG